MADKKLDPFDVEALEKSLNDSATRVSTIWVSFLVFSLYLLIAATTVEPRQLLLAEPVKLPVLNIDLPLWGFFFLAPILLLIFHGYVLLQVLLLGRTAVAYNEAVDRHVMVASDNARIRQRLANTLFAQIFSGSPRERKGWLGRSLKVMAWITLAIAPVLILLVFQFMFLPYHSEFVTWTHRLLILMELAAMFQLWPLVLDARRDLDWTRLTHGLRRKKRSLTALWFFLTWPLLPRKKWDFAAIRHRRRREFRRVGELIFPIVTCLLFFGVSLSLATFPGERLVNLFAGKSLSSVQCERWFHQDFIPDGMRFDRLNLSNVDVVDDEKLKKIEQATADRKLRSYQGERTRNFSGRDLSCGNFSSADFRRVDLSGARLSGARLDSTELDGALLDRAELRGASLSGAKLRGASLFDAKLQGASLAFALLQGASLEIAELQGASLSDAKLQGADLQGAKLQGADLDSAELQGADLSQSIGGITMLQGASLNNARLQGADLRDARLRGASLDNARLQGAILAESSMNYASLYSAYGWRAKSFACAGARVKYHKPDAIIEFRFDDDAGDAIPAPATPEEIAKFIARSIEDIPDLIIRDQTSKRMRGGLVPNPARDDTAEIAKVWKDCEESADATSEDTLLSGRTELLRYLVCGPPSGSSTSIRNALDRTDQDSLDDITQDDRNLIANRIIGKWFQEYSIPPYFAGLLARSLLANNGRDCPTLESLDKPTKDLLRATILPAAIVPQETTAMPSATAE